MKIEIFFYNNPVFRYENFVAWKKEQGTENVHAVRMALAYYTKLGRLKNIRRGLYAVVPPNLTAELMHVDPYLIAGTISANSIVAYHTALELHGVAYSTFKQYTFIVSQKIKPFHFQGRYFKSVLSPGGLKKNNNFGVQTINRQGLDIQVTTLARTFVDVIDRIDLCGGWEEVLRSIQTIATLNVEEVIQYGLKLGNHVLAAKIGFLLEQRKDAFKVDESLLKSLLDSKPKTTQYATSHKRKDCQLIKKWNLLVPKKVLKQLWEEPNYDI